MKPQSKLYDRDTERQLVGAALLEPALFANSVDPADFYLEDLRTVWETGRGLLRQGITPDQVTLADALERRGADIRRSFIASLAAESLSTGYAQSWAATIREYARRRSVFAAVQEGLVAVQNGADIDAAIDSVLDGLERLLDDEARQRRDAAEAAGAAKSHWTARELLAAEFAVPASAVPGILPVGLTLLTGEPLAGKSWLALQLAAAVAAGGRVFGREVEPGRVLYLAADDGPRRLQGRAARQGLPPEADISFATGWPGPPDAALADLERVIGEGEYRLVVLDTISALAASAEHATTFAAAVRRAALFANAAALVVDRVAIGRDILARVACDAALNLERAADGATGVLRVTGRDVEPQEIALAWQPVTCTWHLASERGPARSGDRLKACHGASSPAAPVTGNGGGRKA